MSKVSTPSKHVLIIGAGGFGKGIATLASKSDPDFGKVWDIKGFLDNRPELQVTTSWPIVGDPQTYEPVAGDLFVCALGDPAVRRHYTKALLAKGADFMVLRPQLHEACATRIGRGSLFELNVSIGADTQLGEFVTVLSTSIIGHDVVIGDYVQIGSFVFVGGGVKIGNDVVIHPHAALLSGITVGDGAVIGMGAAVFHDVPAGKTVVGNPARVIFSK
jgi:sugar O-acyltransferase (sialic acid O-acetyltransferase NeuD family)